MSISCNPGDLIENSKCILSCTDEGQRDAMKVWLLAQIAGVNASPGFLLDQSKCLECLNEGQLKAIQAWLLCQISNGGGTPCPPVPNDIWFSTLAYWNMDEVGVGVTRQDVSLHGYDLSDTGTLDTVNAPGLISNCVSASSNGSQISYNAPALPDITFTGFTIHGWFKVDSIVAAVVLFDYQQGIRLVMLGTGELRFIWVASVSASITTAAPVSVNTWHRFCMRGTVNGTMKLMVDTTEISGPAPTDVDYSGDPGFIRVQEMGGAFNCMMDELSFWTRELSDPEVAYLYNSGAGHTFKDP